MFYKSLDFALPEAEISLAVKALSCKGNISYKRKEKVSFKTIETKYVASQTLRDYRSNPRSHEIREQWGPIAVATSAEECTPRDQSYSIKTSALRTNALLSIGQRRGIPRVAHVDDVSIARSTLCNCTRVAAVQPVGR